MGVSQGISGGSGSISGGFIGVLGDSKSVSEVFRGFQRCCRKFKGNLRGVSKGFRDVPRMLCRTLRWFHDVSKVFQTRSKSIERGPRRLKGF